MIYMDFSWIDSWLTEIRMMNSGKIGQPYSYPESLIRFLAMFKSKGFVLRELQGIMKVLSDRLGPFPVISFSQIRRRILDLEITFSPTTSCEVVGVDGSGFKVTERGEWIRHKWSVRRGWVKVVLMGNTQGDIVDIRVGNEYIDERKSARGLIRTNKSKTVLLDGLHDNNKTYNLCKTLKRDLIVPARSNSSEKGMSPRANAVKLQKKLGYEGWVNATHYGMRWVATEGIFSAVKRIFGEGLKNHKTRNIYQEAKLKFWAYQRLRQAEPLM